MSGKWLSVIIWLLIGLLMIGYNILVLKSPEYSLKKISNVKILKEKLNELNLIKLKESKIIQEKKSFISKLFAKSDKTQKTLVNLEKEQINLPSIQGIVSVLSLDGKIHRKVLINGKEYIQGQIVKGFFIEKITGSGVYLSKHGKKWFVSLKEVKFSIVKE